MLVALIREMPGQVKIGFEAMGGQEWVLWATLVAAQIDAGQLSPAQTEPSGHHAFGTDGKRLCPFPRHAREDRPGSMQS